MLNEVEIKVRFGTIDDYDWNKGPEGTCDHCGGTTIVKRREDPYLSGVHGQITEITYWCYRCYCERCQEI